MTYGSGGPQSNVWKESEYDRNSKSVGAFSSASWSTIISNQLLKRVEIYRQRLAVIQYCSHFNKNYFTLLTIRRQHYLCVILIWGQQHFHQIKTSSIYTHSTHFHTIRVNKLIQNMHTTVVDDDLFSVWFIMCNTTIMNAISQWGYSLCYHHKWTWNKYTS